MALANTIVRTGDGIQDTRQRRSQSELLKLTSNGSSPIQNPKSKIQNNNAQVIDSVIAALIDGRLLVGDRLNNETIIDLTHESLMQGWERFARWREGDRDVRRVVQRVEDARREWQEQKQSKRYLLEGRSLQDTFRLR